MASTDNIIFNRFLYYHSLRSDGTYKNISEREFCDTVFRIVSDTGGYPVLGFRLSYYGPCWISNKTGYGWARGYIIVQNTHYDYGDIMNIISFEGGDMYHLYMNSDTNKNPHAIRYKINSTRI